MTPWRLIATTNVSARPANSEVNPFATGFQTLLAAACAWFNLPDGAKMRAAFTHRTLRFPPQSGPANLRQRFMVHRIIGSGDFWVSEYVLRYDTKPFYTVSIMEFHGAKVAFETQYFADPFEASEWRKKWVENMDSPKNQGSLKGTFAGLSSRKEI
jgi:hypothetical protein